MGLRRGAGASARRLLWAEEFEQTLKNVCSADQGGTSGRREKQGRFAFGEAHELSQSQASWIRRKLSKMGLMLGASDVGIMPRSMTWQL